ncbi:MAG: hypothetical protein WDN66_02865 [Candidatus Saccharibacteria bacterium]
MLGKDHVLNVKRSGKAIAIQKAIKSLALLSVMIGYMLLTPIVSSVRTTSRSTDEALVKVTM